MSNPGKQHWKVMKWIFRYLRGTAKLGLEFRKRETEESMILQGYVDVDFGGDLDKRRSTTGYVFTLAECVTSWKAELQDTVALLTTEAEYMVVVEASKEALWLKGLVGTFGIIQVSVRVHCDSQSAIHLAKDHRFHKRTKHIDMRYHRVRQWLSNDKVIVLEKISMKGNPTDLMMKTIQVKKFRLSLDFLHVIQG